MEANNCNNALNVENNLMLKPNFEIVGILNLVSRYI